MKIKLISIYILALLLCGCETERQKRDREAKEELNGYIQNKYVYFDQDSILHSNKDCYKIRHIVDMDHKKMTTSSVFRKLKAYLKKTDLSRCCTDCVSDEYYESIVEYVCKNDNSAEELKEPFEFHGVRSR